MKTLKTLLRSRELTCPSCVAKIESALNHIDGVSQAKVHFNTGRIEVEHAGVDEEKLVEAVRQVGYNAQVASF
jgi:copper chaperone CopZ